MSVEEVLKAVEQVLLSRPLSPVERLVLRQSWLGQSYSDIAENSPYGSAHIKEVGSRLWHDLSEALGERVTKKNLQLVWQQYRENIIVKPLTPVPQQGQFTTGANANFPSRFKDNSLNFPGSPVPLDSPLYIKRPPIEELAYAEITQPGCVIRIKAPKQMGKTSLLNRILARSQAYGYKSACVDFQEADTVLFTNIDKFLRWLCANVSRQLNLDPKLDEYWDEEMGSKSSCKIYFQHYLLELLDSPFVLAFNEVNRVFEHPKIAQDFLPMLRAWHEQARADLTWQKLRLVVVHATEIYVPLKLNQSPFNVGLSIRLPQFTSEQVQELAGRYGLDWTDSSASEQLMAMVGGHPYLVNVALYHLCRQTMTLDELLQSAPTPAGIYSDHLRGHLAILKEEPQLADALQQVLMTHKSIPLEAIAAYKLESMGLVQLEGNQAKLSCDLYRLYFCQQLKLDSDLASY
jgi:hypothetical protein